MLVGPSGCGKTTALRMIAGLEDITSGDLYIGGQRVNDVLERDRDIAMVFQSYALYPHMTVAQNIALQPALSRTAEARDQASASRRRRGCSGSSSCSTGGRSSCRGGQRQRVAMGRAIIRQPQAFLMDEPLSNLDAKLRVQMRGEIEALQKRLGVDDRLRHARPGRGDDDGRPRRRPARRACSSRSTRRRTSTTGRRTSSSPASSARRR